MKYYSLFDATTGLFVGRVFGTDLREDTGDHARVVAANIPEGHGAVEGMHDHLSRRVDLGKVSPARQSALDAHAAAVEKKRKDFKPSMPGGKFTEPPPPIFIVPAEHVIDYQPPQPSSDHEWDGESKRWKLSAVAAAKVLASRDARARIAALVATQHPLIRRLLLAPDEPTRAALVAIDEEIGRLETIVGPGL